MSKRRDHRRPSQRLPSRDERLRERVAQGYSRRWNLDSVAADVLRAIFAQCSFRFSEDGKFSFRLPRKISVSQQIRITSPLRGSPRETIEHVIREFAGHGNLGARIADILRLSLANPLVGLSGKSPFDDYLEACRNSGMHWGILRALRHLRDVITVTEERFFTDPTKVSMHWRLHADRVTPAMLQRVTECLQQVDAQALHSPACNRWLPGIQRFFEEVNAGTFHLPDRLAAPPLPTAGGSAAGSPVAPSTLAARLDDRQQHLDALRQNLLPQYLDLAPEDFAALCRADQTAGEFAPTWRRD